MTHGLHTEPSSDLLPPSDTNFSDLNEESLSSEQESAILELYSEIDDNNGNTTNEELNELFSLRDVKDSGDNVLDDLLAESMQAKAESDLAKRARHALHQKDSKLGKREKEELQSVIRTYEARREWYAKADVVYFHVQHCTNCGHSHKHFLGFYQRQLSRFTNVDRWVRAEANSSKNLPKETRTDVSYTNICSACLVQYCYPEVSS